MANDDEVGMIGLGVMGAAIGRRLLQTRHPLRVFDVRAEAMQELADAGADTATAPQDLATCSVVVLSLNTTAVVEAAVFGPGGLLTHDAPGILIIDMSSIEPSGTRDLAARSRSRGAGWVDAPLSAHQPSPAVSSLSCSAGPTRTSREPRHCCPTCPHA